MVTKFLKRKSAYRHLFLSPEKKLTEPAGEVLADLKKFCWLEKFLSPDPYALALAEGRRQVYWRIQRFLNLDEQDLNAFNKGDLND